MPENSERWLANAHQTVVSSHTSANHIKDGRSLSDTSYEFLSAAGMNGSRTPRGTLGRSSPGTVQYGTSQYNVCEDYYWGMLYWLLLCVRSLDCRIVSLYTVLLYLFVLYITMFFPPPCVSLLHHWRVQLHSPHLSHINEVEKPIEVASHWVLKFLAMNHGEWVTP